MAVGDVHVVNDPLMGQGANTASHSAFVMGWEILNDGNSFDEFFCRGRPRGVGHASMVTEWNNYMVQVPPALTCFNCSCRLQEKR